jgi:putative heme-binding domain-containing protein
LSLDRFENVGSLLEGLLKNEKSSVIQITAIKTLGEFNNDRVVKMLIESWPTMTPRLRTAASDVLFSRRGWIVSLLDAVEANEIPVTDIDYLRLKSLSSSKDAKIRQRALNALKQMQVSDRKDVLEKYAAAKTLAGNPEKGKLVFQKTCTPCHRLEGVGHEVGPNLAQFKNRGIDAIYENVLDPNKEVGQDYVNYTVDTKTGRSYNGMVSQENENSVVLVRGEGETQTILRSDIDRMQRSTMSIMPEGLEKNFETPQVLADLMSYIMSVK